MATNHSPKFAIGPVGPGPAAFRAAREAGFERIEVPASEAPPRELKEELRRIQALVREFELEVVSVHAGWDVLDGLRPQENRKLILRDLEFAARLRAKLLVIHYSLFAVPERLIVDSEGKPRAAMTVDRDLEEWPPMLDWIRSELAACIDMASPLGLAIAFETDVNNSHRLLDFIEGTDPAHCGICFDAGHAEIDSGAASLAELLGSRVICTHLHDNHGAADDHLPPFQGVIDWPGVLTALRRAGYGGLLTYETISASAKEMNATRERLQYLWRAT